MHSSSVHGSTAALSFMSMNKRPRWVADVFQHSRFQRTMHPPAMATSCSSMYM